MKKLNKNHFLLINGFLAGIIATSAFFYFSKHDSYEECVMDKITETQSDQAARMLHVVCKKLAGMPKYNFSTAVNPFQKPARYVFED
ncbi:MULTISPECIES: hypothetical protein [unclassified Neptuniibacter]|uniref:hypothetical protein n=1 Tax=unclassified Neptuniibacter TaxID=2630693 RepID=UPI000C4CA545|nr:MULTISPECIES: hypothetical protein [unclassified Neptuniibacter]MAY41707.1 hypothetical protein [Oceanospirillaceae bacterium]|tara:strand:+ start:11080 stop:11340 length:261 start_codon:yes stop_codon:yes gene_type:complete